MIQKILNNVASTLIEIMEKKCIAFAKYNTLHESLLLTNQEFRLFLFFLLQFLLMILYTIMF